MLCQRSPRPWVPDDLDPTLVLLLAGAFFAAFTVGAAGFGDALIAAAFWLHILAPVEAVPLIVLAGLVIHGVPFLRLRKELNYNRLWPFLLAGALCVPIGATLLKVLPADPFRWTMAVLLIGYALFRLVFRNLPDVTRGGKPLDVGIGAIGGVLGGLAGLSGVVVTIWCSVRGWSKAEQRGVFQPFCLAMHAIAFVMFAANGSVNATTGWNFLIILPAIAAGSVAGLAVYRFLDESLFTKVILGLLLVSGILLLL